MNDDKVIYEISHNSTGNEELLFEDPILRAKGLGLQIACVFMDSLYLILWIVLQYYLDVFTNFWDISSATQWTLSTFKIIFAMSTLTPIIVFLYVDLSIMIIRGRKRIKEEEKSNK